MSRFPLPALLGLILLPSSLVLAAEGDKKRPADPNKTDAKGIEFFETKIRPVLAQHCYKCHSTKAKKSKGGLLLDSRAGLLKGGESGPAIVPGDDKDSVLMEALRHESVEMPPDGKLPDEIIADFATWIRIGAPDPRTGQGLVRRGPIDFKQAREYWAFQPPKKHAVPRVSNTAWPRNDIDRFVLAAMEDQRLYPVEDADRRTLLRRTYFALIGMPPSPEEIKAFVNASGSDVAALDKVIDRLLESPQFGERWGRHWLDVARYAESAGKERNRVYPHAWRYRNYVIDAFNKDKPYDQFVREQIAGDLLASDGPEQKNEQLVATGFLAIGPKGLNERNREKFAMDVVDDQIDVSCRAIIGLTVQCARCHDHKFDPIPTTDYYALAGIYRSTNTLAGVSGGRRNQNGGNLIPLAASDGQQADKEADRAQQQNQRKIKALASQLQEANANLKKLQQQSRAKNKKKGPNRAELQRAQRQVRQLQNQLQQLRGGGPAAKDVAMGVREGSPADIQVCVRGDVTTRGPTVPRGFVTVIAEEKPAIRSGSGRLELARWFSSRENPLTARVAVNRIWQHLFGAGIVTTTDNFGKLGALPTHPELLDTLAVEFMNEGWSTKKMIRRIMLSRVFALGSGHHAANYEVDPLNNYLWRASRRRLEAEAIRDAMLVASGQIDLQRPAGSPVSRLGNGEIGRGVNLDAARTGSRSRSVYLPVLRQAMPPAMSLFDVADPSLVVGARDTTTVATQALFMMNSPFVQNQSQKLAERLLADSKLDEVERIGLAYELSLSRAPTKSELERGLSFLREYQLTLGQTTKKNAPVEAWASFCQAIFASAEFRYVY